MTPGLVLADRYELVERIGQGGHGAVFRAIQRPLGREVAVKMLLADAAMDPSASERFAREATLVKQLEHPNTVRLYDFGTSDTGMPFMVFELLRGVTLDHVAARGPMPAARVGHIARQILKSLMEAHGLGIVHRDIKPSNVLLAEYAGEHDFVKLLDFGVARTTTSDARPITQSHQVIGTPAYMAPEQINSHAVGPTADLYALGLVMAEILVGAPVLSGPLLDVWLRQAGPEPLPLTPYVTGSVLGGVISRALEKNPAARFPSAEAMLVDLDRALAMPTATTDPLAVPLGPPTAPILHEAPERVSITSSSPSTAPLMRPSAPPQHVPVALPPQTPLAMSPPVTGPAPLPFHGTSQPPSPHATTAPPSSAQSSRGVVFLASAIVMLALVIAAAVAVQVVWFRPRLVPAHVPSASASASAAPATPGALRNVTREKALERLTADGWTISYKETTPSQSFDQTTISGWKNNGTLIVNVAIYDTHSDDMPTVVKDSFPNPEKWVTRVDGRRVLAVSIIDMRTIADRKETERVVALLVR